MEVAILLATYNGEKYIAEQMDSLLVQSCEEEMKIYVHDDGSKDSTSAILEKYAREHPELIDILQGEPTGSACDNFFFLVNRVQAKYYFFCDQDDIWHKEKVRQSLAAMKKLEQDVGTDRPLLVFSDLEVMAEDGATKAPRMSAYQSLDPTRISFRELMIQNVITGCAVAINDKCAEYMRRTKPEEYDGVVMHDWWAALIAAKFGRIGYIDAPLARYRQHDSNTLGARKVMSTRYLREKLPGGAISRSMREKEEQTALFLKTYHQPVEGNETAYAFSVLHTKTKWQRLAFYRKNHVWKSGVLRNIGLVLFG